MPSESYFGVLALRVPYTCQEIAETADLAFLALLRINNFLVFSGTFSFDPLLQHQHICCHPLVIRSTKLQSLGCRAAVDQGV